jgi:broad specificity phosphatase PhoE
MQTATIIADVIKKPLTIDSRLREQNLGIMQDITQDYFALKYKNEWLKYVDNDPDYVIQNGESILQTHTRCIPRRKEAALYG